MTASTEAGVGEFSNELEGRHHVKPDQSAATDSATGPAVAPNNSGMHPNDTGVPSAHTASVPGAQTEAETKQA